MKRYATRPLGSWATFGILMLISLSAWVIGSPVLAFCLGVGAIGAMFSALAQRIQVRRVLQRVHPMVRHHG